MSEAAPWYSWVGPVGEVRMIMTIHIGPVGDHWVKVLDLELQDQVGAQCVMQMGL